MASTGKPSRDEVFDAMKNLRRRYALYHLKQQNKPVELGKLAEQVAAWENDTTEDAITGEQRKSVYSALYQTHLPKLEHAGVVEYDRSTGLIQFSEDAECLDFYLANDLRTTVPWDKCYLGLATAGLLAVTLAWMNISPFALLSGLSWAGAILSVLIVTAAFHHYDVQRWQRRFDGAAPDFLLEFDEERRW